MPVAYPCKCGHTEKYCTCARDTDVKEYLLRLLKESNERIAALEKKLRCLAKEVLGGR
jgi:hypothetical protein